ncbi:MAG TPA: type II secretion system protein [Malonomonas sp.]
MRFLNSSGLSLIELVIAMAIMAVLAAVVLPMAEVTVTRTKELELRRALREIRTAIDEYKVDYDKAVEQKKIFATIDASGYPESLEALLEGSDWGGMYAYKKRYLRRLPKDPFDRYDDGWGECSYEEEPPCTSTGGRDLYDVSTKSNAIALDGSSYNEW